MEVFKVDMNIMHNIMERLRPLVALKQWDYCVVWKLSEDQRSLEWMDCCCGGTETIQNGGEELLFPGSSFLVCRDVIFQHPRTKSCDLLSQLPSSIPLDSGIHTQTLISNQPRWLNFSSSSDSSVLEEIVGTRVLIPVPGGLIELFVDNQVPEDQNAVEFIISQCYTSMDPQMMINSINMDPNFSIDVNPSDQFPPSHVSPAATLDNMNLPYDISVDRIRLCDSSMKFLQNYNYTTDNRSKDDIFLEGTNDIFFTSKPMNVYNSSAEKGFDQEVDVLQNIEPLASKEQQGNDRDFVKHETGRSDSVSDCSDQIDDEDDLKFRRRNGKGPQSKNLVAERRRRKKLNDRLYALRALVPKISKLDRASILGDAIEFIKDLQKQARELQDELEEHCAKNTGVDVNQNKVQPEMVNQNGVNKNLGAKPDHVGASGHLSKQNHDPEITNDEAQQMESQVEVAQIDGNEFFVKVFCEHKAGGFVKLMEALDSLGLEVTNASVTRFRALVSNVFKVEKRDSEMVQVDHVRDSLLELTRNPPGEWHDHDMTKPSDNNGMDYHHHHNHIIGSHQHNLHHLT